MKLPIIYLSLVSLICLGCAQAKEAADMNGSVSASPMTAPREERNSAAKAAFTSGAETAPNVSNEPVSDQAQSIIQNRMVIRSANLSIRVDNVEAAEKSVSAIIAATGGYVDSATSSDLASDNPVLTIAMRVPVREFDRSISKIEALGVRLTKTISSQDVTEQVVDIDARVRTMKVEEESYRKLLARAGSTAEIIPLQQRLTELRGTIESISAQRQSLSKQAALSNISLTLQQSAVMNKPPQDPNWLAQTWGESTTSFGGILRAVAGVGIWFVVFSPFWAPILYFAMRARRHRRVPITEPNHF
jgi:hypothetical protein